MYDLLEQQSPSLCLDWSCNKAVGCVSLNLDENPNPYYLKTTLPLHTELQHSTGQPRCAWHQQLLSVDPSALGDENSFQGWPAMAPLPPPTKGSRREARCSCQSLPREPRTGACAGCWKAAHAGGELCNTTAAC